MIAYRLPEPLAPLADAQRWVVWRYETVRGRSTKVPYTTTTRKASSTNPRTWRTFTKLASGFDGPGVVLGDGLQGVDLDVCIDADGHLEPWADAVVQRITSYTEVSPSGRGLKIIFNGPEGKSAEVSFGAAVELAPGVEKRREMAYYTGGRYFTVTGKVYGAPLPLRTITDADAQWLREQIEHHRAQRKPSTAPPAAASHHSTTLPRDLERLIVDGPGEGADRSAAFHHAVRWAADCGLSADRITVLIEGHPGGVGAKYQGRVAAEVERSLAGYVPKLKVRRPALPAGNVDPPVHDDDALSDPVPELSDDALALDFVARFGAGYRWSPGMGWMGDNGVIWRRDDTLSRYDLARRVCRTAAAGVTQATERKRLTSAKTVGAVLSLAQSDQRIVVPPAVWDANAALLNTPAGVVDLRTGAVRARRADDYVTQAVRVAPDFTTGAEVFDNFMLDIFGGDHAMVEFMQRALGYCLTGDRREQVLFFWHGTGANGKSTLLDVVQWLLDTYALKLPAAALMVSRNERHPTELAQLRGRRVAISSELEEGQFWNEALIKELTGDEVLTARFMRQDFFEFAMTQKHVIVGNHKPRLRGADPAMARRLVLVPFEVTFNGAKRDRRMLEKLKAEAPAIMAWMVRGAVKWYADGLAIPERVRGAVDAYLADHDDLALWMAECCDRTGEAKASELYASFTRWKQNCGEHAPSMKVWAQRLQAVPGITRRMSNGVRYTGLSLASAELQRVRHAA